MFQRLFNPQHFHHQLRHSDNCITISLITAFFKYSNSITQICHLRSHSRIILHIYNTYILKETYILLLNVCNAYYGITCNSSYCSFIRFLRLLLLFKTLTRLIEFQFRFQITITMNLSGKVQSIGMEISIKAMNFEEVNFVAKRFYMKSFHIYVLCLLLKYC